MAMIGPLATSELALYYQPQMTADGRTLACAEALIRKLHPTRGISGPGEFLNQLSAEELEALDLWVLDRASRDMRAWPGLTVSINAAATQFRHADFAERALETIADAGGDPSRLEIEIVEASIISDFDAALANINRLRAAGVRIALDDFGTGYSSLTYLLKLPLDKVKIDRSFIQHVDTMQAAAIVHAIVALARSIGLKVTAEGVETLAQQRFLRAAGCH